MSRILPTLVAGVLVASLTGAAGAGLAYDPDLDITYVLGGFNLDSAENGGVVSAKFRIVPPANDSFIVGFSFSGTVAGIVPNFSWASDLRLVITDPLGNQTSFGGESTPSDFDWDFQGIDSSQNGFYESGPHLPWLDNPIGKDGQGEWIFVFTNDWNSSLANTLMWSDVTITFHKLIPAPGALALLSLAGLASRRRRRQ